MQKDIRKKRHKGKEKLLFKQKTNKQTKKRVARKDSLLDQEK